MTHSIFMEERRKQMGPVYRCALCSTKMKLETQAGRQVYACPECKGYCVAVKVTERGIEHD